MKAAADYANECKRVGELSGLAAKMAVAFRDKFDFSTPEQYDKMAEHGFLAAEAVLKKKESLLAEANSRFEKGLALENMIAERDAPKTT
ncbi:MAG: hypothetical protein ABSH26_18050 [Opitutaceae bacterium]